jgi:site-specific recombinase XerC
LGIRRYRSIVLLMLLGGLRVSEVRSLRLADIDLGMRQVLVTGKGAKQRLVPVERTFFAELSGYRAICATNARRVCRPRSVSWCRAVRRRGRR